MAGALSSLFLKARHLIPSNRYMKPLPMTLTGLGQHQDDVYDDYKGQQVFLFQNNNEVAVPFLVSAKNYGLLWDQYAVSWFGDTGLYQPISSLKLYSQNNEEGWLTASYCNDKNNPAKLTLQRRSPPSTTEFLGDRKQPPAAFISAMECSAGKGLLNHLYRCT